MKYSICITVDQNAEGLKEVTPYSQDNASIFIAAQDLATAENLLKEATAEAAELCKTWDKEAPTEKRYELQSKSIEAMDEDAADYEATPQGQRFVKEIDRAADFLEKHSKGGLNVTQLWYLANKYHNSLINGYYDLVALTYKRGYRNGKEDAKNSKRKVK